MTSVKRKKLNIILFFVGAYVATVISLSSVVIYNINTAMNDTKVATKQAWRSQANRTLSTIRNQFLTDLDEGKVVPKDKLSVQKWAHRNIASVRNGGETSDAFMIAMPTEQFIWDGSPDCQRPEFIENGRYMKDEASMHQDPMLANTVLNEMRKLYDTSSAQTDWYWRFDDSPELLEWVIVPNGVEGFNNEPKTTGGVINGKYNSFIIALGTQEDEILKPYSDVFHTANLIKHILEILDLLIVLGSIVFLTFYIFKETK